VWPDVHSPHVTLEVVGGIDEFFADEDFPGVRFLGMVDDLGGVYREADVIVLPVTNGGGIAIKTLEAIQHEKPIVATHHAFRGLPADVKDGMRLCGDEADMIEDLAQLARSREDRLARQRLVSEIKRRLAAKHYDAVLEQHLDQLRNFPIGEASPAARSPARGLATGGEAAISRAADTHTIPPGTERL
jgi:glycosyltransferase involved in cell wall biosynthesis